MKKVSMKDIAKELKISITTVSFVINGKSQEMGISTDTTNKVHELIKKWGFKPNSAARMLRTGKSQTLGLIVEDIGNYFFGNIAKIIEIEAQKNGYSVFFSSTEGNDDNPKGLINKMKNSSVDGFIITATDGIKDEILLLQKENVPFVLIDRLMPEIEANYVVLDNYSGAYQLAKHLLDNGYTNIGFISLVKGMSQMIDRKKGFMDALSDAKFTVAPKTILEVPFDETYENIIAAIRKYLVDNPNLDALFFATNYLGVIGIEALQRSKLKIATDIAMVCFDDNDLFRLFTPSITVASQPIKELATESIGLLLNIIKKEKKQVKPTGKIIQPTIIIRESSPIKLVK